MNFEYFIPNSFKGKIKSIDFLKLCHNSNVFVLDIVKKTFIY